MFSATALLFKGVRGAGFEPAKQYVLGPKPSAFDQARRPPPNLPYPISQMNLTVYTTSRTSGPAPGTMADFTELSRWLVPRRNKVHIVIFILTILMVPGALKALEPIDMESYDLESPELTAEKIVKSEFSETELIVAFSVGVRDPGKVGTTPVPVPLLSDGTPDWDSFAPADELIPAGTRWGGVEEPHGGILNLTILREIDARSDIIRNHTLGEFMKPLVNDVTGLQNDGVMSLGDIFRGFMANESILTQPKLTLLGNEPAAADWSDCGVLECLTFDDPNVNQSHIDLAAARMADAENAVFLRWITLDRGFVRADENAGIVGGPVGGELNENGTWENAKPGPGRWSGTASWIIVQLDVTALHDAGWTDVWKDSFQEIDIEVIDEGVRVGGFRVSSGEMVLHPPNYENETCPIDGEKCSLEWSIMHLEGMMRSHDNHSLTLQIGQAVNVEVNRELQSSGNLIILMGFAILILLYASLRRVSDVMIVSMALGGALLWMQGLIGHAASLFSWLGIDIISRSQFSNLLPILVLALGIDDSLHALHRYKEERGMGRTPLVAGEITISRVGRAIMLTSITTIAAFSANLFSNVAALRSFGVEAGLGILSAFILTGIWAPLVRVSFDQWMERKGKDTTPNNNKSLIKKEVLQKISSGSGTEKRPVIIALIALLLTIPAAYGMSQLEGDFSAEMFLDESSDFVFGVDLVNERFSDEGEPALLLIEGDVTDPEVFTALKLFRENANNKSGVSNKITIAPNGSVAILAIDEMIDLAGQSHAMEPQPFWDRGLNESGCEIIGKNSFTAGKPDTSSQACLVFVFGLLSLEGIPGVGPIPHIPSSIIDLYVSPTVPLDTNRAWLDINGEPANYERMLVRFGITNPEDFPSFGPALERIREDLKPLTDISSGDWEQGGEVEEDKPLTWVMTTGKPVIRYVASEEMQNEMQSGLILGAIFVFCTLSVGFRSTKQAAVSLVPILLVVVWLYGLIYLLGYSLNIVTVTIATISLGVGIDYCIHVTERYREGRENGENHRQALVGVGGACSLALVGSAMSDIAGFAIIATSPMGLFNAFGLFSAMMILLSLIAAMILTTAALGLVEPKAKTDESTDVVLAS